MDRAGWAHLGAAEAKPGDNGDRTHRTRCCASSRHQSGSNTLPPRSTIQTRNPESETSVQGAFRFPHVLPETDYWVSVTKSLKNNGGVVRNVCIHTKTGRHSTSATFRFSPAVDSLVR